MTETTKKITNENLEKVNGGNLPHMNGEKAAVEGYPIMNGEPGGGYPIMNGRSGVGYPIKK